MLYPPKTSKFDFLTLLRGVLTTLLTVLCAWSAQASYPIVRNFQRSEFNGGPQTWAITQDTLGTVYFGNKYGLIIYDSRTWQHAALANESEVRSLYYDDKSNRIYAGGTEEFGYFQHDGQTHNITYHSLKPLMADQKSNFKEIWKILRTNDAIWFQGDYEMFQYAGHKVIKIPSTRKITCSAILGNNIYIGRADGSLAQLTGGKLVDFEAPQLAGKRIVGITSAPGRGTLMAFTEFDGVYLLDGNNVVPYPTSFDTFMKENQVFCVANTPTALAIGTVNRGILIKSTVDNSLTYLSRETGLQNNTVLSLAFDSMGNLWAGLDNGIDFICYNSPMRHLLGVSGSYGAGYVSYLAGNTLYLGTNQGLYTSSYPIDLTAASPSLTSLIRGQIWHIDNVGGTLFASTDGGLYAINGGSASKIEGLPGTWSVQALRHNPDYALASTYDNFYLLHNSGGRWVALSKVNGYDDIGGYYFQDERGNIWITHWMRGIYRLRLNIEKRKFDFVGFYDDRKGLPQAKGNGITAYGDQVIFTTVKGYYIYDPVSDVMKPHPTLNNLFKGLEAGALVRTPTNDIWNLGAAHTFGVARSTASGGYDVDSTTFAPMAPKMFHGFENFNYISPREIILSGQDGFYVVDPGWRPQSDHRFPLRVASVVARGDTVVYNERDSLALEVPYTLNSLRFEFVLPEYRTDNAVEYSCYLEDYDKDWNYLGKKSEKEYTGLHEGNYTLHIRAKNLYTQHTEESRMQFTVLAPWYRSTWAKIVYLIIGLILLNTGYRAMGKWEKHRAEAATRKKDADLNDMRQRAAADALEKEVKIADLKGQQLEQQVRHKSEELSNAMLNLARKNEMLLNISDSLTKLQSRVAAAGNGSPEVDSEIKKIQSLISQNISHDDDWRKFTHNFDAVYEGFTKRLQELHPTLTRTELKVCCYLRMGLSSKDMAPLFSISYRSVEMTRYRLRKKLNLSREVNLVEYLESL